MSRTAVVGGGAAGFFLAVNLKEMVPQMQVDIFERSNKVLAKVELSGGRKVQLHQLVCLRRRPLGGLPTWS